MERSRRNILVIEDDEDLSDEIVDDLGRRGYDVSHAATGLQGLLRARKEEFDLLIIDRMLPEITGLSIVEELHKEKISIPILVISALGDVGERVKGLEAGADDYLTKPFSLAEFGARVEALLRRPVQGRPTLLQAGSLALDLLKRVAWLDGEAIELTGREFQLLEYFMRRPNQLITRDMLIEQVWKYRFSPQTNVVDVHISKLRRKIDSGRETSFIKNSRGLGFMFNAED